MLTLLSDRYAPTTSSIGFLQLPLEEAVEGLVSWRHELGRRPSTTRLAGSLPDFLERLAPLVYGASPREVLVSTAAGEWTAYFDSGADGSDADAPVGYLSERLRCQGLVAVSVPHTVGKETPGRCGAVQFVLYGPVQTEFLNYVRTVGVTYDEDRWHFDTGGTVQAFERTEAYTARRIRDRFTSRVLAQYCAELGVHPFDQAFYTGPAVLVESAVRLPRGTKGLSYEQVRRERGIVPGLADSLPG